MNSRPYIGAFNIKGGDHHQKVSSLAGVTRNRLNILSIHQSKGLEFPLVIVDISSDFKINHAAHAFKRFPNDGGRSQRL